MCCKFAQRASTLLLALVSGTRSLARVSAHVVTSGDTDSLDEELSDSQDMTLQLTSHVMRRNFEQRAECFSPQAPTQPSVVTPDYPGECILAVLVMKNCGKNRGKNEKRTPV